VGKEYQSSAKLGERTFQFNTSVPDKLDKNNLRVAGE
jgi:hypothetical protein